MSVTVPCTEAVGTKNKPITATQTTARHANTPPAINKFLLLLIFLLGSGDAGATPLFGMDGAACATCAKGDPQLEQTELLLGFSVPQFLQTIVFGCCETGGACIIRPASRALPSFKSPPHCEHVSAVAGLRAPQNPQWMSAPPSAAWIWFLSVTNF